MDPTQSSPRRPKGLPAGASLSERIAALQRSSSGTSEGRRTASSVNIPSGRVDAAGSTIQGSRSASAGQSTPPTGGPGPASLPGHLGKNSAAVKDRIARFQAQDKPLIPRSSFGSPAPMQNNRNVHRPYPGASGSGSGQWGEGILRPQMTGGTFATEGKGFDVRPQLTGSAWLGVGQGQQGTPGTSPPSSFKGMSVPLSIVKCVSCSDACIITSLGTSSPNGSIIRSRSPVGQRDAFLELEEDAAPQSQRSRPLRRGSSFTDAQMAAASMGLARVSRTASNDGTADSVGTSSVLTDPRDELESTTTTLPDLPSAPTKDLPGAHKGSAPVRQNSNGEVRRHGLVDISRGFLSSDASNYIHVPQNALGLPSAPAADPMSKPARATPSDHDVEIGIGGASAAQRAQMQRKISDGQRRSSSENATASTPPARPAAAFLSEIRARGGPSSENGHPGSRSSIDDGGASDIGRLVLGASDTDGDDDSLAASSPHSTQFPSDIRRMNSQRGTPRTSSLRDLEQRSVPVAQSPTSSREPITPSTSGDIGATKQGAAPKITTTLASPRPDLPSLEPRKGMSTPDANGTDSVSSAASQDAAAQQAKAAISAARARNASQPAPNTASDHAPASGGADMSRAASTERSKRIQRPEPGRMMTAAEMDASDDEYEPGAYR